MSMTTEEALALIRQEKDGKPCPFVYVHTKYGRLWVSAQGNDQFYIRTDITDEQKKINNFLGDFLVVRGVPLRVTGEVSFDPDSGEPYIKNFDETTDENGRTYKKYLTPIRIDKTWDAPVKDISDAQRRTAEEILLFAAKDALRQEPRLREIGELYAQHRDLDRMNHEYREKKSELDALSKAISARTDRLAKALNLFIVENRHGN